MGQYYMPTIMRLTNGRFERYQPYEYEHNGMKLMEHSYIGNSLMNAVMSQLYHHRGRLMWVGDYAEIDDIPGKGALIKRFISEAWEDEDEKNVVVLPELEYKKSKKEWHYIINHTTQEYIDLEYYVAAVEKDFEGDDPMFIIHPLSLLTAVGNGKGGGDYHGTEEDLVGEWAGDVIEVSDKDPCKLGYIDVTYDVRFYEGR